MKLLQWLRSILGRETRTQIDARESSHQLSIPISNELGISWSKKYRPQIAATIEYADRDGEYSERSIAIACLGLGPNNKEYLGIFEDQQFKTLRRDRVLSIRQSNGESVLPFQVAKLPRNFQLPTWTYELTVFRIPSIVGKKHWTVDLATYTCSCPEKRTREMMCHPQTVGRICPHMARAIRENLPLDAGWHPQLIAHINSSQATSQAYYL